MSQIRYERDAGLENPSSKDSQKINHRACDARQASSSSCQGEQNHWSWKKLSREFNIKCSDPLTMHSCLNRIKSLQGRQLHPHIFEMVELLGSSLDFDIKMEEWDTEFVDSRRQVKQCIKACESHITTTCTENSRGTLALRTLDFLDELKRFLNIRMMPNSVQGAVASLFQCFANLVNINFRPGNAMNVSESLAPLGDKELSSAVDLRAFLPVHEENWDLGKPSVLALALVMAKYSTATKKGRSREYDRGDSLTHDPPSYLMAQNLLGQLVGSLLLEYESSAFRDEGKILGFGVQGSLVQLFVLHMRDSDYYAVNKRSDSSSTLTFSQPCDIMRRDQRNELLDVMATLASFGRDP